MTYSSKQVVVLEEKMPSETKSKSGFCIQSGKKIMKMVAQNSECWDIPAKLTFLKMAFDPYEIGNCNRKP